MALEVNLLDDRVRFVLGHVEAVLRRMPALLIRTSRPPKVSIAWFTSASAPDQLELVEISHGLPAGGDDLVHDLLHGAGIGALGETAPPVD